MLEVVMLASLLVTASGSPAGGTDAVYQRLQSDGAVKLTNVPDAEGYQILVTGPREGAAGPVSSSVSGNLTAMTATIAIPARKDAERGSELAPETAAPRVADTPPSIEARKGQRLDPEVAPEAALLQTREAQDQIVSAGGTQSRLLNLYQASMSAFQKKRPSPPQPR
jgi:hypothetical protein